jgi:hypothetical protein
LSPAAFAHSASFSPATAASPHRVVSFINVVGCGTFPSSGIRQNRRHEIESLTSAHRTLVVNSGNPLARRGAPAVDLVF